jgi:hypothetical protein
MTSIKFSQDIKIMKQPFNTTEAYTWIVTFEFIILFLTLCYFSWVLGVKEFVAGIIFALISFLSLLKVCDTDDLRLGSITLTYMEFWLMLPLALPLVFVLALLDAILKHRYDDHLFFIYLNKFIKRFCELLIPRHF